jgi:hypothetical protein
VLEKGLAKNRLLYEKLKNLWEGNSLKSVEILPKIGWNRPGEIITPCELLTPVELSQEGARRDLFHNIKVPSFSRATIHQRTLRLMLSSGSAGVGI